MFLLALDCSTSRGSMALGHRVMQEPPVDHDLREFPTGRGCGGEMFLVLQEALAFIRNFGEPLAEIIVGLGPGSYSGVRQSIAAATGLAAATGATLYGVPSVLGLASGRRTFHAVGDARRGTFYYTAVQNDLCLAGPELLADATELARRLAAHPDWPVCAVESALPGGVLPEAKVALPSADVFLFLAPSTRLSPPLEPIYLRPVNVTLPGAVKAREP